MMNRGWFVLLLQTLGLGLGLALERPGLGLALDTDGLINITASLTRISYSIAALVLPRF